MSNRFKTPILEKWFYMFLQKYPTLQKKENELKNMLKGIDLPDKHPSYEHFYNELHLDGCGNVIVVWNIEKILKSKIQNTEFEKHTVQELKTLIDFNDYNVKEAINKLLPKGIIEHRADFITLAMFPGFPQLVIIDGNHRILENLNNPFLSFKCYVLADETILDYLEPNSRKFAEFIYYLNQLIQN